MKKKMSDRQKKSKEKINKAIEAYAICGDPKTAARLVGVSLDKVVRAFQDDDGIVLLQKYLKKYNPGDLVMMSVDQRRSFLSKCAFGGILPRVVFNFQTGEPTSDILFEPLTPSQRLKCIDMINRMDGVYTERREIIDKTVREGELSPAVKSKINEILSDASNKEDANLLDISVDEDVDLLGVLDASDS